jgi:tRNA G18 (ribose-2'-O)-methylase SpoU
MDDLCLASDPRLESYARIGDANWLRREGLFVAEGRLVVERLIGARRFAIESILTTPAALQALSGQFATAGARVHVVNPDTMRQVTGFNFHRGCLALARRPAMPAVDSLLEGEGVLLVLEAVGNPDNIGGLFRTAAAFGVRGVLVNAASADPLYRKAVRTSMGAVLQVPWTIGEPWPDVLAAVRSRGWRVAALTPHPDAPSIDRFAAAGHRRTALLVGAEGPGLSDAALAAADDRVRIPIAPSTDSLNVTVAAGIALHALAAAGGPEPEPRNLEPEPREPLEPLEP